VRNKSGQFPQAYDGHSVSTQEGLRVNNDGVLERLDSRLSYPTVMEVEEPQEGNFENFGRYF